MASSGNNNKPVESGTSVNILYMTTRCNLDCTYCYEELGTKVKKSATFDELKKQVDLVLNSEPVDKQTLFVIFGGEPTLEWDNIEKIVDYTLTQKQNVMFNIESNGLKFLDKKFLDNYLEFIKTRPISLDISFDGIGNFLRKDHKGDDSTGDLVNVLNIFKDLTDTVNWRIRYTITKANHNDFAHDLIRIVNTFNPRRIIIGEDTASFTTEEMNRINNYKNALKHLWESGNITIPMCDIFCDTCDGCGSSKVDKKYFQDGEIISQIDINENQSVFRHFEEKIKKGIK